MSAPPVLLSSAGGRKYGVMGDAYRFLSTAADTDGRYAIWEALVPPGGGPPPHVHSREEEGFWILEGEITLTVEGQQTVATPGTFANLPPGTRHSFRNDSNRPARMLIMVAPAGLEEMFFEAGVPLSEGQQPTPPSSQEIERMLTVAPKYGIQIFPPAH